MMIYEIQRPYDFDEAIELVEAKVQGWVVPKVYDFQASMRKYKQPDLGKVKVVKFC